MKKIWQKYQNIVKNNAMANEIIENSMMTSLFFYFLKFFLLFLIYSLKPSIFLYGIRCWCTVEEQVQIDDEEQGMQDCESNKCLFLST